MTDWRVAVSLILFGAGAGLFLTAIGMRRWGSGAEGAAVATVWAGVLARSAAPCVAFSLMTSSATIGEGTVWAAIVLLLVARIGASWHRNGAPERC